MILHVWTVFVKSQQKSPQKATETACIPWNGTGRLLPCCTNGFWVQIHPSGYGPILLSPTEPRKDTRKNRDHTVTISERQIAANENGQHRNRCDVLEHGICCHRRLPQPWSSSIPRYGMWWDVVVADWKHRNFIEYNNSTRAGLQATMEFVMGQQHAVSLHLPSPSWNGEVVVQPRLNLLKRFSLVS